MLPHLSSVDLREFSLSTAFLPFTADSIGVSAMCDHDVRFESLAIHDTLDHALSQIDEAEKLFYAGEHDAALVSVRSAISLLDGIR